MFNSSSSHPYTRSGAVDPNYSNLLLGNLESYLQQGTNFARMNAADRLSGFFLNTLTDVHASVEVPTIRSLVKNLHSKATIDSYIDHLKVAGDGIIAALGSIKSNLTGSHREAYVNESATICGLRTLLATTAIHNFGFLHLSARQQVTTVGYNHELFDSSQTSCKFYWLRAEKHFQTQAATSSRYVTEAAEDFYKNHQEVTKNRNSKVEVWTYLGRLLTINLEQKAQLQANEIYLKSLETSLIEAKNLYLQAAAQLTLQANQAVTINGAQIFFNTRTGISPPSIPTINPLPNLSENSSQVEITNLPAYPRSQSYPNQKLPTVLAGSQQVVMPPI